MRMRCQIIRYTWRRRFQEILIHPKIKWLCLPTWKQEKNIPLSHCLPSHGGNVLFIYPHLNALGWGWLHFVGADALAAKVFLISFASHAAKTPLVAWHKIPSHSDAKTVVWQYKSLLRKLCKHARHITIDVGVTCLCKMNSTGVYQMGTFILR